jgi:hypothetical protein
MSLKRLEILEKEPVTLAEAKGFLRIDQDSENEQLELMIRAARATIEAYTSRALVKQKWQFTLNSGYALARSDQVYLSGGKSRGDQGIILPRSPFIELCGLPILVSAYGEQEIKDYRLDTSGRSAHIHFGGTVLQEESSVRIEFLAGYTAKDLPDPLKQAILMLVADLYENRHVANDTPALVGEMNGTVLTLIKPYQVKRLA